MHGLFECQIEIPPAVNGEAAAAERGRNGS